MDIKNIKTVLVIGAGVMGHGIAQLFAQAGYDVRLTDISQQTLDKAQKQIASSLKLFSSKGKISSTESEAALKRISFITDLATAAKGADYVIEAVSEVPEIKKDIFSKLDTFCSRNTIFATNTSGLDVFSLVEISNPSRLVCAHFFAPAQIIPLVEVCPGPATSKETIDTTVDLLEKIGKKPVVMKQFVASFIVNRVQNYIGMAVFEMLNNGWATPDEIDTAVKAVLGVRLPILGVVQTMDFNGLDLVNDIMKSKGITMPCVNDKVQGGHLGVKTSKGFYDYNGLSEEEILEKRDIQLLRMLDHLDAIDAYKPI